MDRRKIACHFAALILISTVMTGCSTHYVKPLTGNNNSSVVIRAVYVTQDITLSINGPNYKDYLCEEFKIHDIKCHVAPREELAINRTQQLASDVAKNNVSHILLLGLYAVDTPIAYIKVELYGVHDNKLHYSAIMAHQISGFGDQWVENSEQLIMSLKERNFF